MCIHLYWTMNPFAFRIVEMARRVIHIYSVRTFVSIFEFTRAITSKKYWKYFFLFLNTHTQTRIIRAHSIQLNSSDRTNDADDVDTETHLIRVNCELDQWTFMHKKYALFLYRLWFLGYEWNTLTINIYSSFTTKWCMYSYVDGIKTEIYSRGFYWILVYREMSSFKHIPLVTANEPFFSIQFQSFIKFIYILCMYYILFYKRNV